MKTIPVAPTTLLETTPCDTRALLAHPDVVRAVEGTLLRQGVRRVDLPDGVAEVQLRALEATADRPQPADLGGWKGLACVIAERMAIKNRQRKKRRSRYDTGLCEEPDRHGPIERSPGRECDPVDARRWLDVAETTEHGAAILAGVVDGRSAKEIASQLALTEGQVNRQLFALRNKVKNRHAVGDRNGRERN